MFEENRALLIERFPFLGLQMATWEKTEYKERRFSIDLEKVELLYVYGLSVDAYFQAKGKVKLVYLVKEPGTILSFLEREEAYEILSDLQVDLSLLGRGKVAELSDKYPFRHIEIVGAPSRLRLQLLRKTTLSYSVHLDRIHGYQPFQNFVQNLKHLPGSFYANGLKNSFANIPAIVCGAGPSLQVEELRKLENKALIIAGGSTIAALSSKGVMPHFGMAIDPNLEEYRRLKNSFAFEAPLLYSTRVFPGIFRTCNGPFGYMRSGIGGVNELWIEEELGLLEPLIGDFLSSESISVTTICLAWAQFLGCNPIFLNGIDLAYTGKKRYAGGVVADDELSFQAIEEEKSAPDRILKRKDRGGNAIYTAVRWVMEAAALSHFAKKHKEIRFVNTTDGGIGIQGIEYQPLATIQWKEEWDLKKLVHQKIMDAPMPPHAKEQICAQFEELKGSLKRVIAQLKILCGKEKGSPALAEMDLKEELAYSVLFYDAPQLFKGDWGQLLPLAEKYLSVAGSIALGLTH